MLVGALKVAVRAKRWAAWLIDFPDSVPVNRMAASLPHLLAHFSLLCLLRRSFLGSEITLTPHFLCLRAGLFENLCSLRWMNGSFLPTHSSMTAFEEQARGREGQKDRINLFAQLGKKFVFPKFCSLKWGKILVIIGWKINQYKSQNKGFSYCKP